MTGPVYLYRIPEQGEPETVEVDPTGRWLEQIAEALGREPELIYSMRWRGVSVMLAVVDYGLADLSLQVNYRAWSLYGGSPIVGPALVFYDSAESDAWRPIPEHVTADIVAPVTDEVLVAMGEASQRLTDYDGRW